MPRKYMRYALPIVALHFCVLTPPQVTAQTAAVPRVIRYSASDQATAQRFPGGTIGAVFSIYGEQEGGSALWSETQNIRLDKDGKYSVLLGSTTNEGLPIDLFESREPRWLSVELQVPGWIPQPRAFLGSVPYAFKAADADTLGGLPASAYQLAHPVGAAEQPAAPPGTSTATPVAELARAARPYANAGVPGYIPVFSNATDLIGSVMYQNGTNIGIGTTSAGNDVGMTYGLTINGTFNTELTVQQNGVSAFALNAAEPVAGAWSMYDKAGGFWNRSITSRGGNVGIGTTTPVTKLEVNGNTQVDGNLTVTGSILGVGAAGPVLVAPNNGSNDFAGGIGALSAVTTGGQDTAIGTNALHANTTGGYNTALGYDALYNSSSAYYNIAVGAYALLNNVSGWSNSAVGYSALNNNTTGGSNAALGANSLVNNTTACCNSAIGYSTLNNNTTGASNTALGYEALYNNSTAALNTAVGAGALYGNVTGGSNTAVGTYALYSSSSACCNTALGMDALYNNTTASGNTALGYYALYQNGTGGSNTAIGYRSLVGANGTGNLALGYSAGQNLTSGSNNVYISHSGLGTESGAIHVGTPGMQTTAFIAGVQGVTTGSNNAVPVVIDSNGQLGTISSSRRFKEDIRAMADASSGLMRLRPVTFRYKQAFQDGAKPVQYGLIAEEVAEVYPELVVRSADGQIETVKYQMLDPMLLNELQKQAATIAEQKRMIDSLEQRLSRLESKLEPAGAHAVLSSARH